jgi:hypothetical protein
MVFALTIQVFLVGANLTSCALVRPRYSAQGCYPRQSKRTSLVLEKHVLSSYFYYIESPEFNTVRVARGQMKTFRVSNTGKKPQGEFFYI